MVLEGQPEPPRYFAEMKRINRDGPPVLGALAPLPLLSAADVASRVRAKGASVWCIDLRPAATFAERHVPGSLSVPYGRSFSTWVGSIVPYDVDVILLAPNAETDAAEAERLVTMARSDLLRIGLDRVCGWSHADQVITAIEQLGGKAEQIPQRDVNAAEVRDAEFPVVDVRGLSEWSAGHLPHAQHIPLGDLAERLGELPQGAFGVQCQSGARSAIATSLLHRLGRSDAVNLQGGYAAWQRARQPVAP
jgi:hydroxyacylglutathione hydrolase